MGIIDKIHNMKRREYIDYYKRHTADLENRGTFLEKIHNMKRQEYIDHYKWYATADPEIRDKFLVNNFHLDKESYSKVSTFCSNAITTIMQNYAASNNSTVKSTSSSKTSKSRDGGN